MSYRSTDLSLAYESEAKQFSFSNPNSRNSTCIGRETVDKKTVFKHGQTYLSGGSKGCLEITVLVHVENAPVSEANDLINNILNLFLTSLSGKISQWENWHQVLKCSQNAKTQQLFEESLVSSAPDNQDIDISAGVLLYLNSTPSDSLLTSSSPVSCTSDTNVSANSTKPKSSKSTDKKIAASNQGTTQANSQSRPASLDPNLLVIGVCGACCAIICCQTLFPDTSRRSYSADGRPTLSHLLVPPDFRLDYSRSIGLPDANKESKKFNVFSTPLIPNFIQSLSITSLDIIEPLKKTYQLNRQCSSPMTPANDAGITGYFPNQSTHLLNNNKLRRSSTSANGLLQFYDHEVNLNDLARCFIERFLNPALNRCFTLHAAQMAALNALSKLDDSSQKSLYLLTRNFDQNVLYKRTIDVDWVIHHSKHLLGSSQTIRAEVNKSNMTKKYDVFGRKYGSKEMKQVIDFGKVHSLENNNNYMQQSSSQYSSNSSELRTGDNLDSPASAISLNTPPNFG